MPGNPDGVVTDEYVLHPKSAEIDDFADRIRPEILDALSTFYGNDRLKERAEMIVELVANELAEWLP